MTKRKRAAALTSAEHADMATIFAPGYGESGHVRIRLISELKQSPENFQPLGLYKPIRRDDPAILELRDSIITNGFVGALVISLDDYILSGHRRHVAADMAGLVEVPCIVDPIYRRDPENPFMTNPAFIARLEAYNRQREKTLDELLRESIVKADPHEAHRALSEYRQQHANENYYDDSDGLIELRGTKRRARISDAKVPFMNAIIRTLNALRNYWPLTDRQIHYRILNYPPLVHASKPRSTYRNKKNFYKNLCDLTARMRLEGRIPFECIDDTERVIVITKCWPHVGPYLTEQTDGLLKGYYRDLMQSQPNHIEVMYEKLAGYGFIKQICLQHCIPLTVGKGFSSLPPRWKIAQRFKRSGKEKLIVLAMSDLDPDGDEIAHSFARSMRDDFGIEQVELIKVGLRMDQAIDMDLPMSEERAKKKSSNYQKYIDRYDSDHVWELEALSPETQQELLLKAIDTVIDIEAYNHEVTKERSEAAFLEDKRSAALAAMGELTTWQENDEADQ